MIKAVLRHNPKPDDVAWALAQSFDGCRLESDSPCRLLGEYLLDILTQANGEDMFKTLQLMECKWDALFTHLVAEACLRGSMDDLEAVLSWKTKKRPAFSLEKHDALFYAIIGRNKSVVQRLLDLGVDPNTKTGQDNHTRTPLFFALQLGDIELAQILLDASALINGPTRMNNLEPVPVFGAAALRKAAVLDFSLANGADLTVLGSSVLHFAIFSHWDKTIGKKFFRTPSRSIELLGHLLALGVPVDSVDEKNMTPLMVAIGEGWVDGIKFPLDNGADIEYCAMATDFCYTLFVARYLMGMEFRPNEASFTPLSFTMFRSLYKSTEMDLPAMRYCLTMEQIQIIRAGKYHWQWQALSLWSIC